MNSIGENGGVDRNGDARPPVVLIIRDGWGYGSLDRVEAEGNAVMMAKTPVNDRLVANYPWCFLIPAGESVGLPVGQMGNSEVGHLNLGAGRIVYQHLTRIAKAIDDESFFVTEALLDIAQHVKDHDSSLHLMGLCSDGGVHSHLEQLFALLEFARRNEIERVFIHCFTDGRDTSPTSGADFIASIQERAASIGVGTIASICGRYYAMDRDRRWERVMKAYETIVDGKGELSDSPVAQLREYYAREITDEFIPPTTVIHPGAEPTDQTIRDDDAIIFFNFRADRARQLTTALIDPSFDGFQRLRFPKVHLVCFTQFDETYNLPVAFPPQRLSKLFTHIIAENHQRQLRMAETEKYAHVTFFFNGGVEEPVNGEERCLIPSPQVATYDLKPEMSATKLTEEAIARIASRQYDVVILNFANPDMVGHTGDIPATIKAVETVDQCLGDLLKAIEAVDGAALVTADHGNAERMIDDAGNPHTAHTSNPVQCIYFGSDHERWKLNDGILADVAPTLLAMLGLPVPDEMTGRNLLIQD